MVYENKLSLRLVAFIIDYLCLQIVTTFLLNLGLGVQFTILNLDFVVLSYWQQLLLYFVYFVGFALFNKGTTVGKMLLSLKVVQGDYDALPENKLLIREVLKVVFMPISFISFIVALFNEDNKSIHDLLIDSVVVKEKRYVKNPYNTINDDKSDQLQDGFIEYNTPNDENSYKVQPKKEYVDPLDEDYKIDDEDY